MMRKLICLLAITAATFLTTSAFAANTIEVNVTSEPVEQHGTSEKAGGYTMTFDSGTVFNAGDQITIDLPLTITLSKDIDIVIPTDGIVANATAAAEFNAAAVWTGADVAYFHITGDEGTQRVNVDISMTLADVDAPGAMMQVDPTSVDNTFVLNFFDQNGGANTAAFAGTTTAGDPGVYIWTDAAVLDGVINYAELADATMSANTRCINLSGYDALTVLDSIDSQGDLYIVDPSNPQVAHVVSATTYTIEQCEKAVVGRISIGVDGGQGGLDSCDAFDFETGAGYCDSSTNKLIITATKDMEQSTYNVELEILTDGVYWTNGALGYETYATQSLACADGAADNSVATVGASGAALNNECTVATADKDQTITVSDVALVGAAGQRALWLDLPAMNYDLSEITEGDDVEITVTITKAPCGTIINQTFTVGTLGCIAEGVSQDITFPYFTEITGDSYWDGFAITNLGGNNGTAVLTIYEQDGDVFTASVDVSAHSMAVMPTSDLLAIATQTVGTGTMGDARFYMEVEADFNVDGFAMIANSATGESMGYLPRK
jgi:hypothetical protein